MFGPVSKGLLFFLLYISSMGLYAQTVRINELCAANSTTKADAEGDFSDWIELYNASSSTVNLDGWSLTDDPNDQKKWVFLSVQIPANSYMIVFASGKDTVINATECHTNFKLSSDGEYLALSNNSGEVVSSFNPSFPQLNTDQSFGYYNNNYIVFNEPTPGAANNATTGIVLPAPVFSHKHGFYKETFSLQLSSNVANATIFYSLDGSDPGINGLTYTKAISITGTTIVRAIVRNDGGSKSEVATQTYLFVEDIIHQSNKPDGYPNYWGDYAAISGKAIADYEMDPEMMANAAKAQQTKEALKALPVISIVSDKGNFFSNVFNEQTGGIYMYTGAPGDERGLGWERPASVEYFDANDSISLQVNCAIELHGGHSRRSEKSPKHSFRLRFSSDYGPSKLAYPFFGTDAADHFEYIVLRAGFGYAWNHHSADQRAKAQYINDDWCKRTQLDMGDPATHSVFAHLFINGLYWGIYNANERLNKDFAETYLGGDADDYDVIKDYSEAIDGTIDVWNRLIQKVNAGVESNEAYQNLLGRNADGTDNPNLESYVDAENLINYMLINFYSGNSDWDHHNWVAMRNRVNPGKGFQFFCWDAECTLMGVNDNVTNENNNACPSNIFQQLMKNDEFKRLFADKVLQHCTNNGLLSYNANLERWLTSSDLIEKAIDAEAARWGDYRRDVHNYSSGPYELYTKEAFWIPQHDWMLKTYFPTRTGIFIRQLQNAGFYPNLNAPTFLVNGKAIESENIKVGDQLTMPVSKGVVYYTTTGNDPVIWNGNVGETTETQLVANHSEKYVLVPTAEIGNAWYTSVDMDVSAWEHVNGNPGGVGYETGSGYQNYISYDVKNRMYTGGTNPNTTCYIRIPFTVDAAQLEKIKVLNLKMRFDDGFVAYLNGIKIASDSAPDAPLWNSVSTAGNESNDVVSFSVSDKINLLKEGNNLLAIQGLNQKVSSSDFLIMAELVGATAGNIELRPDAQMYTGPITLSNSVSLKARAYDNGVWSAMNSQYLKITDDLYDIKITEINYNPVPDGDLDGDLFEFIELKNSGLSSIDLMGCKFVDGIDYEFTEHKIINPSEFIVLASSNPNFYNRYNFWAYDQYNGQLNNSGEKIVLANEMGDTLVFVEYSDKSGWPEKPDGDGYSLVPVNINPTDNQNDYKQWRASYYTNGSPGSDDLFNTGKDKLAQFNDDKEALFYNYPNPFVTKTTIRFGLPTDGLVKIDVLNSLGAQVAVLVNENMHEGNYMIDWEINSSPTTANLQQGIYFCRMQIELEQGSQLFIKKMLIMK